MIEAEEMSDSGPMIGKEEDILLLEPNPEVITIQEGHSREGEIVTEIEVTADKQGSEVNLDHLPKYMELHQDFPVEIIIDALGLDNVPILPKNV